VRERKIKGSGKMASLWIFVMVDPTESTKYHDLHSPPNFIWRGDGMQFLQQHCRDFRIGL